MSIGECRRLSEASGGLVAGVSTGVAAAADGVGKAAVHVDAATAAERGGVEAAGLSSASEGRCCCSRAMACSTLTNIYLSAQPVIIGKK